MADDTHRNSENDSESDSDSSESLLAVASAAAAVCVAMVAGKRDRTEWTKDYLLKRSTLGAYTTVAMELHTHQPSQFRVFVRMDESTFEDLLTRVAPSISKQDTRFREAIPPQERLFATLRYLASGMSYTDLHAYHKISTSSLCHIIPETCSAIYEKLKDEVLQVPDTPQRWEEVATKFETRWNLPHCLGALDGKHIKIEKPKNSGGAFFNYKKYFSVVLFAIVDADYKFVLAHIGTNGRVNDAGIYESSGLAKSLETNQLHMPVDSDVEGYNGAMPYFIIGDDAFPLKSYLMKPYPQKNQKTIKKRIFNYRLSRARRIVENAFGILANRFRVFHTTMSLSPDNIDVVVMATVCLHNHLRMLKDKSYAPAGVTDTETMLTHNIVEGSWRNEGGIIQLDGIEREGGNNHTVRARDVRDSLADYYSSPHGWVSWQLSKALSGHQ